MVLRHRWEGCTNVDDRRQETRRARGFHEHNERKRERTNACKESRHAHGECEDAQEALRARNVLQERPDPREDKEEALSGRASGGGVPRQLSVTAFPISQQSAMSGLSAML